MVARKFLANDLLGVRRYLAKEANGDEFWSGPSRDLFAAPRERILTNRMAVGPPGA